MKKIKLAAIFAALVSMFTFSSCLDSSEGNSYDCVAIVSVKGSALGGYYLLSDDGVTFNPVSSTVLENIKLTDGTYLQRFYAAMKFQEGEVLGNEKKSYKITSVDVYGQIPYKNFNTQPDTLKGDFGIANISSAAWAANGYVNIPVTYYYPTTSNNAVNFNDFNLYATDAQQDTLYTVFQQTKERSASNAQATQLMSFKMPFDNSQFANYYYQLEPKSDSIVIKITAKILDGKPLVKTAKYRYTSR